MGRIRGFFCSFCLDRNPDHTASNQSFNQDIDVSHLATPHVTSSISPAGRTPNSTAGCDSDSSENLHLCPQQIQVQNSPQNVIVQPQLHPDLQDSPYDDAARSSPLRQQENRIQPSPPTPARSPINHYEPQASQPSPEPQNNQSHREVNVQVSQRQDQEPSSSNNFTQNTKLSYDIISVREPLAKILAERQIQQAQQRQILGDHEYIEVYGERGSSCFYEEIEGSTTSSAAYDQIGGPPNHNYQVLINACASNRANGVTNEERNSQESHNILNENEPNDGNGEENVYDVTSSSDPVEQPSTENKSSCYSHTNSNSSNPANSQTITQRSGIISQSIPVYSVINKGARRSNAIIRATVDNRRPPQPPPKNLFAYQPSTSAIQTYQEYSSSVKNSCTARGSTQVPGTSSFGAASFDGPEHHSKLPKPPPRFSKHPMYNGKNRPLPLPDKGELANNEDESVKKSTRDRDEDIESLNNGYELLNPNFDDDQIDVGYEKIRESNRYSGGSISSQFSPLQVLDNGGYESVQPIYSSPSNALAEPNYEAIGSATASELAAAATAKLTAIEQTAIFKREQ